MCMQTRTANRPHTHTTNSVNMLFIHVWLYFCSSCSITCYQDLEDSNTLQTPQCVAAFRAVDRQRFWVPGGGELAYADSTAKKGCKGNRQ